MKAYSQVDWMKRFCDRYRKLESCRIIPSEVMDYAVLLKKRGTAPEDAAKEAHEASWEAINEAIQPSRTQGRS